MVFTILAFFIVILLPMNCKFTEGTNRAAELTKTSMISAGGRSMGNMYDSLVARMAISNAVSTSSIMGDVQRSQYDSTACVIEEAQQISAVAERAAVLISAAADRCAIRIEQIIQQLSARLLGTVGSAVAVANSQIKLASREMNAIADRTVAEAQLISTSTLGMAERTIHSAAELAVAVAKSDKNAIKTIAGITAKRTKHLAERLSGHV